MLYLHRYPERVKLVPPPDHGAAWVSPGSCGALGAPENIALFSRSRQALLLAEARVVLTL